MNQFLTDLQTNLEVTNRLLNEIMTKKYSLGSEAMVELEDLHSSLPLVFKAIQRELEGGKHETLAD